MALKDASPTPVRLDSDFVRKYQELLREHDRLKALRNGPESAGTAVGPDPTKVRELEDLLKAVKQENAELREESKKKDDRIKDLEAQPATAPAELEQMRKALSEAKETCSALQSKLTETKQDLEDALKQVGKVQQLEVALAQASKRIAELEARRDPDFIRDLKEQLSSARSTIDEYKRQLREKIAEADKWHRMATSAGASP